MKISIILAHPKPGSFNHAIAAAIVQTVHQAGHEVILHDLYAEFFDAILPESELAKSATLDPTIQQHCDEIVAADGIVVIHPNWWAMPPAILKGWVDRVLRMGIAYKFGVNEKGEGVSIGLLKAKTALVFTTSNTPMEKDIQLFGDPLQNLWTRCILQFCGVENVTRINFDPVIVSTDKQRAAWIQQAAQATEKAFA